MSRLGFRFVHTADLHLDSLFKGIGSRLPDMLLRRVQQSTFTAFDRVVRLCIDEDVDFLLIAGDVFDLADRSLRAQTYFQKKMFQLKESGIRVYVCHGNHDPADGRKLTLDWPDNVHFFSAKDVEGVPFEKQGKELARIYGWSYPTAVFTENIVKRYVRDDDVPFAIGLLHTNMDGSVEHDNYAPCTKRELIDSGFDYWALGHIHKRRIVHERNPCIVYPGNTQGRSVKEQGPKGCYLVDVRGNEVDRLTFYETDDVRWYEVTIDVTGVHHLQGVLDRLLGELQKIVDASTQRAAFVRLYLIGETDVHRELSANEQLEELLEPYVDDWISRDNWVFIESVHIRTRSPISRGTLVHGNHFLGDLLHTMEDIKRRPEKLQSLREHVLADVFSHREAGQYLTPLTDDDLSQLLQEAENLVIQLFTQTVTDNDSS